MRSRSPFVAVGFSSSSSTPTSFSLASHVRRAHYRPSPVSHVGVAQVVHAVRDRAVADALLALVELLEEAEVAGTEDGVFFSEGERCMGIDRSKRLLFSPLRLSSVLFPARSLRETRRETALENSPTTSDMTKRRERFKEERKRGLPFFFTRVFRPRIEEKLKKITEERDLFLSLFFNLFLHRFFQHPASPPPSFSFRLKIYKS